MSVLSTSKTEAQTAEHTAPPRLLSMPLLVLIGAVALVAVAVALGGWLDADRGWTEALAAAGVVATVIAAAVMLGTAHGWKNGTRLSFAAATTAVIGVGTIALAVVTYVGIGASSSDGAVVSNNVNDTGAALAAQVSNNDVQPPGYAHDVGTHPAFADFMAMDNVSLVRSVPGGTLLPNEVDLLKEQLAAARAFAEDHNTVEKARAAGFRNTTNDVPFMGAHFINSEYLLDGKFEAGKPEGLLFSKLGNPDGEWQLVGVWYLLIPGVNPDASVTKPPEGFAGKLDLWHAHLGLCTRSGVISENNSAEACAADNGNFIGDLRWMMHVWVWPEEADNPEGVFTYLNTNLYEKQTSVQAEP